MKTKKTNKVTATPRQIKGAKAVIENLNKDKPQPIGQVLKSVGYGSGLQHQPKRVLESKGFQEELSKYGLTKELVTCALVEDIKKKPQKRVSELSLASDILKMRDKEKGININFNLGNILDRLE